MPYVERTDEEIVASFEKWLAEHPKPDSITLVTDRTWTPREMVDGMKNGDKFMKKFIAHIRKCGKEYDMDPAEIIGRASKNNQKLRN